MWWQVLPPLGIMGGCVFVLYAGQGFARYLAYGEPNPRALSECTHHEPYQRIGYKRDYFLTKSRFNNQGFEALSDED